MGCSYCRSWIPTEALDVILQVQSLVLIGGCIRMTLSLGSLLAETLHNRSIGYTSA